MSQLYCSNIFFWAYSRGLNNDEAPSFGRNSVGHHVAQCQVRHRRIIGSGWFLVNNCLKASIVLSMGLDTALPRSQLNFSCLCRPNLVKLARPNFLGFKPPHSGPLNPLQVQKYRKLKINFSSKNRFQVVVWTFVATLINFSWSPRAKQCANFEVIKTWVSWFLWKLQNPI